MAAPPLPRIATYTPTIVWGSGTPVDTSAYDDVSRYYLNSPGLQIDGVGRDQTRSYAPPSSPAFSLTLTNEDGRFSPGGPLANFLGRGPAVTLDGVWGHDIDIDDPDITLSDPVVLLNGYQTKRLFTGIANTMDQALSRSQRTVSVTAFGSLSTLAVDKKPTTILYENIRTDQAISIILDAIGWDAALRSIDTGDTTLLYWWLNGQTTAMQAINDLLAAEGAGGCAYEDGFGVFHFEGRQFRENNPRSLTPQYSFFDGFHGLDPSLGDETILLGNDEALLGGQLANLLLHVGDPTYTSNPDEVVKTVAATINARVPTPTQTLGTERMKIWEYGSALTLAANQVLDLYPTSADPFKSAVAPVAATDYTVTVGSLAAVALLSTSGQTVTLRLTAGASGATVLGVTSNGIQLRAVSLPVTASQTVTSTVDTATDALRTRPKDPYVLPCWPEIERNAMLDIVNSMALRYRRERRQITFRVVNLDADHMRAILGLQISDRVQFVHTHGLLNEPLWIEQLHYDISPGGGLVTLTIGTERVFDMTGGKFDDAQFDIDAFGV